MKKNVFIFLISFVFYSCSKTESTPTVTPPVVIKISGCDSIKQGLLKTTSDTIRLVSCLSITGCDSLRLGILKPNTQDTIRLLSCTKISGCDSVRLGIFKPNTQDTIRLSSCIKVSGCDSVRLGILKPNTQDTLRLLSCIKISGCDSVRLGLLKSTKDLLRLNCNSLSITIGTQKWMIVNLDIVTYRNGDTIPQVTDTKTWAGLTTGAWCYYNNDAAIGAKYGKLYNWYAVNDSRGLAPQGWHIPTDAEWVTLSNFLGGDNVAGGKLKEAGTLNWRSPNTGSNVSGFSALPGGARYPDGQFTYVGDLGFWWSATKALASSPDAAWSQYLSWHIDRLYGLNSYNSNGFSVRCIKD